jgi:hypothetical protein
MWLFFEGKRVQQDKKIGNTGIDDCCVTVCIPRIPMDNLCLVLTTYPLDSMNNETYVIGETLKQQNLLL